jgi:hypothetical protein
MIKFLARVKDIKAKYVTRESSERESERGACKEEAKGGSV